MGFSAPYSGNRTVARHDHERKLMLVAGCGFYHDVDDTHDLHTLSCICAKRVLCVCQCLCNVSSLMIERVAPVSTSIRSFFPSTCIWVTIGSGRGQPSAECGFFSLFQLSVLRNSCS